MHCVEAGSKISSEKQKSVNLHKFDKTDLFKHNSDADANLTLDEFLDKYSDLFDSDLLDKYSDLFGVKRFKQPPRHHTKHCIITHGPPVCGQVRRLSPEKQILKRKLQNFRI